MKMEFTGKTTVRATYTVENRFVFRAVHPSSWKEIEPPFHGVTKRKDELTVYKAEVTFR